MCPRMAATPQAIAIHTWGAMGTVRGGRNTTGKAPFATSNANTTSPIFAPSTRMTFVAPRFPEPCLRRSMPRAFPAMYADGIEPATYAMAIATAGCSSTRQPALRRIRMRSGFPVKPHASRNPLCR